MSSDESSDLRAKGTDTTVEDIRALCGAVTPHFANQVRDRVRKLIAPLPADHPARIFGEEEVARLARIGTSGEVRGTPNEPGLTPLKSVVKDS